MPAQTPPSAQPRLPAALGPWSCLSGQIGSSNKRSPRTVSPQGAIQTPLRGACTMRSLTVVVNQFAAQQSKAQLSL